MLMHARGFGLRLDGGRLVGLARAVADNLHFELVTLKSGVRSIRSLADRETFHPVIGPVAEADALYVRQLDLGGRLRAARRGFVIWDVGLGGAANVLTILVRTRAIGGELRIVSFDRTLDPLRFALRHAAELGYFGGFESQVARLLDHGETRFDDGPRRVEWRVEMGDFPRLMCDPRLEFPAPDVVLYDAYSPARNPTMWTLPLFESLRGRMAGDRPCVLPTYSRSTMLRVTLLLAGFHVGRGHATGEKEETTIASNVPEEVREPLDADWLRRARASTSAEPLTGTEYRQLALSETSLRRLREHSQFLDPRGGFRSRTIARAVP